jgi:hypothetical protein
MKPSEWNAKIKSRVRVKFEMELDIHTAGATNAQALRDAISLVVDSFKKEDVEDAYSWKGAWVEGCEIGKVSCVTLNPVRYEEEAPEEAEVPVTED